MTNIRVGNGYDVHAFCEGDHIKLGGVVIPHSHGLEAYSDGDVLIHALCDALLGAAALGDIGQHFPDTDDANRGMDSRRFLQKVVALLKQKGYGIGNVDNTVVAQAPKLAAYIHVMRENLAHDMNIDVGSVGIKATTTEKLGFVGRQEGIAAYSVVLLTCSSSI